MHRPAGGGCCARIWPRYRTLTPKPRPAEPTTFSVTPSPADAVSKAARADSFVTPPRPTTNPPTIDRSRNCRRDSTLQNIVPSFFVIDACYCKGAAGVKSWSQKFVTSSCAGPDERRYGTGSSSPSAVPPIGIINVQYPLWSATSVWPSIPRTQQRE